MAKDITLKSRDGSTTYYPKTVSDIVYDNASGKTVKEQIDELGSEMASIGNNNSGMIETKINALLLCVKDLITKIVFHSGTPYQIPTELQSSLILKRYSGESSKAICGTCLCGEVICGQL